MKNRDLNAGLIRERQGRRSLSPLVKGVNSFNLSLQKSQIIVWALVIAIFSAMYGATLGDLETYIESSDLMAKMLIVNPDYSSTDQFVGLLILIMSMITCLPVLLFLNRVLSEEKKGLTDAIINRPVSRSKYFGSFILIASLVAVAYQLLVALSFWGVGREFLEGLPDLKVFFIGAINYVPAIFFTMAVAVLLVGLLPKYTWLSYLYLGYSFTVLYLGRVLDFPEILEKLTPFGILPNYPLEELDYGMVLILLALSLVLCGIGMYGYRKRDIG